jgi:3-methylfumaryl-CoA hydratase
MQTEPAQRLASEILTHQQPLRGSLMDDFSAWVGRSETVHDTLGPTPLQALTATLDHPAWLPAAGDVLPPLWHWLYFLPLHRQSQIGDDGHARRGGFMPPVPLPRRMWAGSQLAFDQPLRVGDVVARTSTIVEVTPKQGRSGPLVFVKVRHDVRCNGAAVPALVEFHDIVYRPAKTATDTEPQPVAAPTDATWRAQIVPNDVLLFRYSALTFNGHRIHYDRRYVTQVEGYPGLVVHGPLIATLLLDLLRRHAPDAIVTGFHFKAIRPTFDLHPFQLNGQRVGQTVRLWAQDHEGWLTMDAVATVKD